VFFDDNHISIDGPTDLSVSDDQVARFAAAGWATQAIDGHDPDAIVEAIETARKSDRPSLIACRTTIAYGAPTKAGTAAAHASPLGANEITATRARLGWPHAAFTIPDAVLSRWRAAGARGAAQRAAWQRRVSALEPAQRAEFRRTQDGKLPANWLDNVAEF